MSASNQPESRFECVNYYVGDPMPCNSVSCAACSEDKKPVDSPDDFAIGTTTPDDGAIYWAFRNAKPLKTVVEGESMTSSSIKSVITRRQDREGIKQVVDQLNRQALVKVIKRLLKEGVFQDPSKAKLKFPHLFPDATAEEKLEDRSGQGDAGRDTSSEQTPGRTKIDWGYQSSIGRCPRGEELAEDTPEKSDWEVLASADVPEIASPCFREEEGLMEEATMKEAPVEYESSPEGKLPTAKAYPVEEHDEDPPPAKASEEEPEEATAKAPEEECIEDQRWPEKDPFTTEAYPAEAYEALAETKPREIEEACGGGVQEEQSKICLPRSSQHNLIVYLQEVLETACFVYGQKQLPIQLRKRGWDCVEAVALHTWMNEFPAMTEAFDTVHRRELLQSVVDIQDIAVKRTRIDWPRMKKVLDDAFELTEVLNVKEYSDIVQEVRIDIGKAVEGLSCKEQEAEDQQEEKLQRIAEERRKLDKCEVEVRRHKENRTKDYRKWAESEVEGILEETRKTLKTAKYFVKLME